MASIRHVHLFRRALDHEAQIAKRTNGLAAGLSVLSSQFSVLAFDCLTHFPFRAPLLPVSGRFGLPLAWLAHCSPVARPVSHRRQSRASYEQQFAGDARVGVASGAPSRANDRRLLARDELRRKWRASLTIDQQVLIGGRRFGPRLCEGEWTSCELGCTVGQS